MHSSTTKCIHKNIRYVGENLLNFAVNFDPHKKCKNRPISRNGNYLDSKTLDKIR